MWTIIWEMALSILRENGQRPARPVMWTIIWKMAMSITRENGQPGQLCGHWTIIWKMAMSILRENSQPGLNFHDLKLLEFSLFLYNSHELRKILAKIKICYKMTNITQKFVIVYF